MTRPDATAADGSHYADAGAARQALQMALPMLEAALREPAVCGSGSLYVVVLDPARDPADTPFDDAVLVEHAVGDRSRWDADYAAFARAKARLAWRTRRDGHAVQSSSPQALRAGDSLLGGAVCFDGIVVGVSGAFECFDEAFATCIAANLRAVAFARRAAERQAGRNAAGG